MSTLFLRHSPQPIFVSFLLSLYQLSWVPSAHCSCMRTNAHRVFLLASHFTLIAWAWAAYGCVWFCSTLRNVDANYSPAKLSKLPAFIFFLSLSLALSVNPLLSTMWSTTIFVNACAVRPGAESRANTEARPNNVCSIRDNICDYIIGIFMVAPVLLWLSVFSGYDQSFPSE